MTELDKIKRIKEQNDKNKTEYTTLSTQHEMKQKELSESLKKAGIESEDQLDESLKVVQSRLDASIEKAATKLGLAF